MPDQCAHPSPIALKALVWASNDGTLLPVTNFAEPTAKIRVADGNVANAWLAREGEKSR